MALPHRWYRIPVQESNRGAASRRARLCGLLAMLGIAAAVHAATIEGRWTTFDDDTGAPRSTVEMVADAGAFKGRVVALALAPGEPAQPVCTACDGARAGASIIGMTILQVARRPGSPHEYSGTVFDPEEGREYRCIATLAPDGGALTLRGFVGIPLFGREATWRRAP